MRIGWRLQLMRILILDDILLKDDLVDLTLPIVQILAVLTTWMGLVVAIGLPGRRLVGSEPYHRASHIHCTRKVLFTVRVHLKC